jgi:hypothetical protein
MEDGTYNKNGESVTYASGYQVGLWTQAINYRRPRAALEYEDIRDAFDMISKGRFAQVYRPHWQDEFGVWTDSSTGEIYVEPCVWVSSLVAALRFGKKYAQKTIWSWAEMKEIEVV